MVHLNMEGSVDCMKAGAIVWGGNVSPRSSLSSAWIKCFVLDKNEYIDNITIWPTTILVFLQNFCFVVHLHLGINEVMHLASVSYKVVNQYNIDILYDRLAC